MGTVTLMLIGGGDMIRKGVLTSLIQDLKESFPTVQIRSLFLQEYPQQFTPYIKGQRDRLVVLYCGKEEGEEADYLIVDGKIIFVFLPARASLDGLDRQKITGYLREGLCIQYSRH